MPEFGLPGTTGVQTRPAEKPSFSMRGLLREATAPDHSRLDEKLGQFDLASRDGYRRFIEVNAAALLPLESALEAAGVRQAIPDWDRRTRRSAITADLDKLGGHIKPLDAPVISGVLAILGITYVLEGSRLGAAYLVRTVDGSNDPLVRETSAYLRHGVTERLWQSFVPMLESHAKELRNDADIVEPAKLAFALFEKAIAS